MLNWGLDKEEGFPVLLGTGEKSGTCVMGAGEFSWHVFGYDLSPTPGAAWSSQVGLIDLQSWMFHSVEI